MTILLRTFVRLFVQALRVLFSLLLTLSLFSQNQPRTICGTVADKAVQGLVTSAVIILPELTFDACTISRHITNISPIHSTI